MSLDFFARPRRRAVPWTAGLAVTALVGTTLVTSGGPAAAETTTIELPSTVLATADELPDGTITRVRLTDSSIVLEVADDGSSPQVWTRDRNGTTAWRQVNGIEAVRYVTDGIEQGSAGVPTGRKHRVEGTPCGGSSGNAQGETVGFDGRFTLVRCDDDLYSVHDRDVYRPVRIDAGTGATLSESWSLNDGVLIGVSNDVDTRPIALNPWTGVVGQVAGAPTSVPKFDAHGDLGVFASGDALHAVDLTPVTSDVLTVPPDSAAPSATVGGRTWSATRAYTVSFTASDADAVPDDRYRASGVARTEARHRTLLRGDEGFGAWSTPVVVGTSHDASAPVGSHTCWQARATDRAGNVGAWSAERCVKIDATAPSVASHGLRPATKATGTTTDVTFRWSGDDNEGIHRYTIRHRATPRGQRTVAWSYANMGTNTSFTKGRARSTTVCFQVKAHDMAGNVSAWSPLRCTYVDGIKPRVTRASVQRWMPTWPDSKSGLVQWHPTFRYAGTDDKGVYRYQRQTKESFESSTSTSTSGWLTSTSLRFRIGPVDQQCARVRVKDRAGNVSAWSRWQCSNAPADWLFGMDRGAHVTYPRHVGILISTGDELMITGTRGTAQIRTADSYRVRAVRLHMAVGPTMGKAHVYVGSTRLGTVDARRATWGMKPFTVRSSTALSGRVRVVAVSGTTATSHLYVIR